MKLPTVDGAPLGRYHAFLRKQGNNVGANNLKPAAILIH
jgi:hypothetical protein